MQKIWSSWEKCPQKTGGRSKPSAGNSQSQDRKKTKKSKSKVQYLETGQCSSEESVEADQWPIFTVKTENQKDISLYLEIEGKSLKMELDAGAAVSIISEKVYHELFGKIPLKPSTILLKTYTSEAVHVLGEMDVKVKYETQSATLPLVVVTGTGPSLFGQNWLSCFTLDWVNIKFTTTSTGISAMDRLVKKFPGVFENKWYHERCYY